MAIGTSSSRVLYTANGSTTDYTFTFPVLDSDDLSVYVNGVLQTSGYSVALNADQDLTPGGTVTFDDAPTNTYPVKIQRTLPLLQNLGLTPYNPFPAKSIEHTMDKIVMMLQQVDRRLSDLEDSVASDIGDLTSGIELGTLDPDNATVTATGGTTPRKLKDHFANRLVPEDFGAEGDGSTNDSVALSAYNTAASEILLLPGKIYRVSTNTTFTKPVRGLGGALSADSGVTVTFNKGFHNPHRNYCLQGLGTYVFDHAFTTEGFPEWFGAVTENSASGVKTKNVTALKACVTALPVTTISRATYYTNNTLVLDVPHRKFRGIGKHYGDDGTERASRIVIDSATLDAVQLGPSAQPASINDFYKQIEIEDFDVHRSVAVVPPGEGSEGSGACGIRIMNTLYTYIRRVRCFEHTHGFLLSGTVRTHMEDCFAFRSVAGTSDTNDIFWGYFLNGNALMGHSPGPFGGGAFAAGGNASSYLTRCTASIGGSPEGVTSTGFVLSGEFVDTFLFQPETTSMDVGIDVNGVDSEIDGDVDLHIINPIVDGFASYGLRITNANESGLIDVSNGYFAPRASDDNVACIGIIDSEAQIGLTNNQGVCWVGGGDTIGLYINNSSGIQTHGNIWVGSQRPVAMDGAHYCRIFDSIRNPTQVASQAAVWMSTCTFCHVQPIINGDTNMFPKGVHLVGTGCTDNEINVTMVKPTACTNIPLYYNAGEIDHFQVFGTRNRATGTLPDPP